MTGVAFADGELQLRTVYYKEKATRVEQPMIDGRFDVGEHGSIEAHVLIDAITSASTASSAEAEPFSETRVEVGGGYTHTLGIFKLGGTAKYSTEPDYTSGFVTVHGDAELLRRNLTVGVNLGYGHDTISEFTTRAGTLDSYLASVSVSQLLSPTAIASLTYDLSYLSGYQENPYRIVIVDDAMGQPHEVVPDTRVRNAVAASLRYFAEDTSTTVIGSYRFYFDDWGVVASTPEVRVLQDLRETMQLGLRYRYHRQNAADFYQGRYVTMAPSITADEKLSKFDAHAIAVKFDVTGATFGFTERAAAIRAEAIVEYNIQHNAFGNAVVAHAALTIPFEY